MAPEEVAALDALEADIEQWTPAEDLHVVCSLMVWRSLGCLLGRRPMYTLWRAGGIQAVHERVRSADRSHTHPIFLNIN